MDKLATPLWDYVLRLYAQTAVRGWLQVLMRDYGIDGSLLLCAAYLAQWHRAIDSADRLHAAGDRAFFQAYRDKLQALQQRQAPSGHPDWSSTWNELLLKTELQAQQVQLAHLYDKVRLQAWVFMPWPQALAHNVERLTAELGLDARAHEHVRGFIRACEQLPPDRQGAASSL